MKDRLLRKWIRYLAIGRSENLENKLDDPEDSGVRRNGWRAISAPANSRNTPINPHFSTIVQHGMECHCRAQFSERNTITDILEELVEGGSVKLAINSAFDHDLIDPAFLENEFDMSLVVEAVKDAQRCTATSTCNDYIVGLFIDLQHKRDNRHRHPWICCQLFAATIWHPVATSIISKNFDKTGLPFIMMESVVASHLLLEHIFKRPFSPSRLLTTF